MIVLREVSAHNADKAPERPEVLAGSDTSAHALQRLSAALKEAPRVQKTTVHALGLLVSASRSDMLSWPRERQDAYFRDALDSLARRFGGVANVLTATIDRSDITPHMQVLVMPRDQNGRFTAVRMIGGPPGLRKLHADFYADVGKKFGLLSARCAEPNSLHEDIHQPPET